MRHAHGFTLIELIAVLVMISIGVVVIGRFFGNAHFAVATAEQTQRTAQIAQECAEYIVGWRMDANFAAMVNNNICNALGPNAGFVRNDILGPVFTAADSPVCPNGANCRNATVTVRNGAVTSVLTVLLVE